MKSLPPLSGTPTAPASPPLIRHEERPPDAPSSPDASAVLRPHLYCPARTNLVDTENPDHAGQLLDMLQDSPHTGEDAVQTIHFASARINGTPALLLFVTTRDTGTNPVPQPSPAHIRVYQLTQGDGEPGSTPFYFAFRTTLISPVTTCHADIALSAATKIPFAKWNGDQEPVPTCPQ